VGEERRGEEERGEEGRGEEGRGDRPHCHSWVMVQGRQGACPSP
jgi:hypothetical protein